MSTPPTPPPKPISLAKIAIALAVIIVIAFGLCARNFTFEGTSPPIVRFAIGVEIVCLVGLIIVGILAIVRSNRRTE